MPQIQFPDPRQSTEDGIIAFGGNLLPETLLTAYRQGIFPWPISDLPLPWFCPPERAVLEWHHLHIPRSLLRAQKKTQFRFTHDQAFDEVINECAQIPRPGQDGTWITDEIKSAYCRLHRLGHAHSIEVWSEDHLVGGIYGVDAGGSFAAESMFHKKTDASKLALLHLMKHLHDRGSHWIDIQVLTPHLEALGARVIPRDEFLDKLRDALSLKLELFKQD
jgi:leucyl/phenylalanyl-tRNA--protein transferase